MSLSQIQKVKYEGRPSKNRTKVIALLVTNIYPLNFIDINYHPFVIS